MNIDELLVSQPDYGEQALEIADMLVRSGAVDVVAVDSVAALTPRAELEGQMGDQTVGVQARMMSQAMRKLAGNLNRTQTLCLFVNQIREKVGVMFGSPETQPGGRALKFYSSQRLDIRRIETLKDGTEAVGNRVRVKVVKNKVAAPFRQAEFDIEFGKGISTSGCILDLGIEHNIVAKSGSFFSYGDERLGQGRNNAKAFLDEHPEIAKEIEAKVYEALGIGQDLVTPIERDEDARRADGPRRPRRRVPRAAGRRGGRRPAGTSPRAPCDAARATPRRASSTPATLAWRALNRRERTSRRAARAAAGKRVEPRRRSRWCSASCSSRATSTTRRYAQRFAEDRRRLDALGRRADRAPAARLGVDARARSPPRSASRTARTSSRPRSRCCAAACPTPPATPRERDRALGMLVRKGYELELALRRRCAATRASASALTRRDVSAGGAAPSALQPCSACRYYDPVSDRPGLRALETPANQPLSAETSSFSLDGQTTTIDPGRQRPADASDTTHAVAAI